MGPSPEDAFDRWFRTLGFRGRDTLTDLPESLRDQLRNLQKMYNEALSTKGRFLRHSPTLPLYFDLLDADEENALATNDGEHYAFCRNHPAFGIQDFRCLRTAEPIRWSDMQRPRG